VAPAIDDPEPYVPGSFDDVVLAATSGTSAVPTAVAFNVSCSWLARKDGPLTPARGSFHPADAIQEIERTGHCDLSDRELTVLPPWIGQLTSLQTLMLDGNRLAELWGAPRLPDSPSIRMDVWKGEVIASTEEELLSRIPG
jgi:hypothetical protein